MELKDFTALVVGVDGSPAADRAAAWACQFADRHDLSVRLLPIGDNRDELIASKYRTREVIGALAAELR